MDIVLLYAMYRMHNPKRSAKKRRAAITAPKIALCVNHSIARRKHVHERETYRPCLVSPGGVP